MIALINLHKLPKIKNRHKIRRKQRKTVVEREFCIKPHKHKNEKWTYQNELLLKLHDINLHKAIEY